MVYYAVFQLVAEKLFCIGKFETEAEAFEELKQHTNVTVLKMYI